MRNITIERGDGGVLRACTTAPGSANKIEISASTAGELQERLIAYGTFTESQAEEIIAKILKW